MFVPFLTRLVWKVATFSQALRVYQRCGHDSKRAADSVSEFEEWPHNALAYTLKLTLILTPSAYSPPKNSFFIFLLAVSRRQPVCTRAATRTRTIPSTLFAHPINGTRRTANIARPGILMVQTRRMQPSSHTAQSVCWACLFVLQPLHLRRRSSSDGALLGLNHDCARHWVRCLHSDDQSLWWARRVHHHRRPCV
jgi:hypothetical protein